MRSTKTITITLPLELYFQLLEEAQKEGRSLSNFIALKLK